MGRDATKAAGNPWYQARKKAAEYDDRLQEGENVQCVDCKCCGDTEPLPVGAEYGEIDGDAFCEECLEDTPLSDLVERCGHDWKTASEEDIPDGYDG